MTPDEAPEVIGSREVCRILQINKSTLTRWVASGRITPAGRLGEGRTCAYVFNRAEVEAMAK
jgi:predicted site-specific integrase-resolvase